MDAIRNPFVPGAGTPPPELAGREAILEKARIALARIRQGRPSKSFLLVGLRGVGKTVLLNRIEETAAAEGYRALMIEAHENKSLPALLLPGLRHLLLSLDRMENISEQVKRGLRALKSFANGVKLTVNDLEIGLDIDPEVGVADSGDLEADLPDLLLAVGEAAKARGTSVAIIIDELQYLKSKELSALIMAIHKIAQKQLPLILIGAGLPQLVGMAGESKSYAERLFDYPVVDALGENDARDAIKGPVEREGERFEEAALDRIIDVTHGYPYFLQEWGYHVWNIAKASPITADVVDAAGRLAIERLDESFFRVRFDRSSPREKDYLTAMAQLGAGPHRSGDIAEKLGVGVQSVAPVRSSLIRKGMIYSPAHGDTAFTVPLFNEFLMRMMAKRKS